MEKILIIGGGLMGSSVAWKLAQKGVHVTVLEQQGEKYDLGSSYGESKIARSLGPKKDVFSYVHNCTIKEVKELIAFLNQENKSAEYTMEDVYSTSPVSYLYSRSQYDKVRKLRYKKQRKEYRVASSRSSFRKFGISIKQDQIMVQESRNYSGTFNPTQLMRLLHEAIHAKGGEIKYHQKILNLVKVDDHFEVQVQDTQTDSISALKYEKVVVAAGGFTVQILKDFAPYFNRVVTPKRVPISYFKISDERYEKLLDSEKENIRRSHPMFSQLGKEYFSMINETPAKGSPIFKAGGHQIRRNIIDIDAVWTSPPRKKEIKWIKKKFRKHMQMLEIFLKKTEIELVKTYNCVYSDTSTNIPLVTNIFNQHGSLDKNIVVVSGMSGVGAKGCLGYGLIGADLITGQQSSTKKIHRKAIRILGNPAVRLYTRRIRRGRLF